MAGQDDHPGGRLIAGRYRLLRELGRGGFGVVWLAGDTVDGGQVAVKELRPPHVLQEADRKEFTQRAFREASSVALIRHPNAVTLHAVLPATPADDAIYLIMEYIDGPTLDELIRRDGPLPDAAVAAYGVQLLAVLEVAHGLGIVHRDIKPVNIMLTAGNQVKLADFGIAYTIGDPRLTPTGVMGSYAYMAPELFEDNAVITPAADLWSLGATLFHAVEGRGPFARNGTGATVRAITLDELPVPRCSPGLAAAITGMLQRDPEQRATIPQARARLLAATGPPSGKVRTPPPAQPTTFTNMPNRVAMGLWNAFWFIPFFGMFWFWALGIKAHHDLSTGLGFLCFALFCLNWRLGYRWRTLVFGPRGFTIRRTHLVDKPVALVGARWEQVARIGSYGRPPRARLCAWVSDGESSPAKRVALCRVGSRHFPASDILTAIQSYCPTVAIEPSVRALADSAPGERGH